VINHPAVIVMTTPATAPTITNRVTLMVVTPYLEMVANRFSILEHAA